MTPILVSDELAETLQNEAEARGQAIEDFLKSVLRRERTLADRQKIEDEQAWWLSLPMSERAAYDGEYVAVHNRTLIDHDRSREALHRRVRSLYGKTAVLIMPAEGPRELYFRSPRLAQK